MTGQMTDASIDTLHYIVPKYCLHLIVTESHYFNMKHGRC